ncbi:DUF459 domain-containing protein [Aquibium carbonis]|uniref:DUF459 domain-containing protein n=1 Tax=Aquibium carbonis TaxID=2495581 RepID=A0A429YTP5_9HYPH|nr:DUF459 domain-containing protein [Aquibium carbonis]RST84825.1 DUF459 domain-containing protein [Aquibium carbonis]
MARSTGVRIAPWLGLTLVLAAIVMAAGAAVVMVSGTPAHAQERPRTLFQYLFRRDEPPPQAAPQRTQPRNVQRAPRTTRAASAPAQRAVAAVDKQEDARAILVVGDFLAGGLAEGLSAVYAEDPTVRVVDRANGSSGFVRDDYYDWPGRIGSIVDEERPAVVVVMIGSNDRQAMRIDGASENVRSERWDAEYTARSARMASEIAGRNVPIVWVGLPSFRFPKMSSDMIAFNDIQRGVAEAAGGVFVDVWDGFIDENGAFVTNGPDINGQPVRLRADDGINFTAAGKRKIAFYVEKPLARLLQSGPAALAPEAGIGEMFGPPIPGEAPLIQHTPPVSLFDPALDGGDELLGLVVETRRASALTPARKLIVQGLAPDPRPGRVDDFGATREPEAASVATAETTSAVDDAALQAATVE